MVFLLPFFLFSSIPLFCIESNSEMVFYDLATIHELRTKQYEVPGKMKILQCSSKRTGSTLVYNVLRYLFEDEECMYDAGFNGKGSKAFNNIVTKTHNFNQCKEEGYCIFVTMRHPVDTLVSMLRVSMLTYKAIPIKKILKDYLYILRLIDSLKASGRVVVLLRYEDFYNNLDHIFSAIEENLSIEIDEKDKSIMRAGFSVENVRNYIKKFGGFRKWDHTLLHGKHIEEPDLNTLQDTKKIYNLLLPHKEKVESLGYSLDDRFVDD